MQRYFDSFHRFRSKRQRERENLYFKCVIEFNAFTYFETNTHTHTHRASFYRNFEPNKCRCCKSFITFYHLILAHKRFGVEYFSNAIITLDFFLLFLHSISIRMAERHQMCTLFGVSRFMHFGK